MHFRIRMASLRTSYVTATLLVVVCCSAGLSHAASYEDGDERLGFINIASDGTTAVTFNATSIQERLLKNITIQ